MSIKVLLFGMVADKVGKQQVQMGAGQKLETLIVAVEEKGDASL